MSYNPVLICRSNTGVRWSYFFLSESNSNTTNKCIFIFICTSRITCSVKPLGFNPTSVCNLPPSGCFLWSYISDCFQLNKGLSKADGSCFSLCLVKVLLPIMDTGCSAIFSGFERFLNVHYLQYQHSLHSVCESSACWKKSIYLGFHFSSRS